MNMPPPPPPSGQYGPYGQAPAAGWGAGAPNVREHPDGTTVLVLGILGLVVCGVLAPFAWVKGNKAKAEIDAAPHVHWTNRGSVTAGRILGIIGTVLIIVAIAFVVLVLLAAGAASTR